MGAEQVDFRGSEIVPNSPTILVPLGIAKAGQGRHAEAERAALDAIELDPQYVDAYLLLGEAYRLWDWPSDVRDTYDNALLIDPSSRSTPDGLSALEGTTPLG